MREYRRSIWLWIILIVGVQLILIDKQRPPTSVKDDYIVYNQVPQDVATLIQRSCYDCHSYDTHYPWYSNVAPVSWVIGSNVKNGRGSLNFSIWKQYYNIYALRLEQKCAIQVRSEQMPLPTYFWCNAHPKMTEEERNILVQWFALYGLMPDSMTISSADIRSQ